MVKTKIFKNMKLCKKFITILTSKVKTRFKKHSLYFKINNNNLTYWLVLKPQPIKLSNLDWFITPKLWANIKETHGHLQGNFRELN